MRAFLRPKTVGHSVDQARAVIAVALPDERDLIRLVAADEVEDDCHRSSSRPDERMTALSNKSPTADVPLSPKIHHLRHQTVCLNEGSLIGKRRSKAAIPLSPNFGDYGDRRPLAATVAKRQISAASLFGLFRQACGGGRRRCGFRARPG